MCTAIQTAIQEENARLKHQIEQLQTVLDNIATGVSLLEPLYDKTGQIVDFRNVIINDYNARRFGKSIQELTDGRGIGELFPGWQQTENFAIYRRVFDDEQPRTFNTFYDQFGLRSWLEVEVRDSARVCWSATGILQPYMSQSKNNASKQSYCKQYLTTHTLA